MWALTLVLRLTEILPLLTGWKHYNYEQNKTVLHIYIYILDVTMPIRHCTRKLKLHFQIKLL